jgi:hypothetical protein
MTLEELSFISQIVAAIAIVVSLIYVAVQLRQTERNQRAAMHLTYAERVITGGHRAAEPHMAEVIAKVIAGKDDLSDREIVQLTQLADTMVAMLNDSVWQRGKKLLDEVNVARVRQATKVFFAWPATRALWLARKPFLDPEFADFIDRTVIKDVPLSQPIALTARWRETMAALREASS